MYRIFRNLGNRIIRPMTNPSSAMYRNATLELNNKRKKLLKEFDEIMYENMVANMDEKTKSKIMRTPDPRSNRSTIVLDICMHGTFLSQDSVDYETTKNGKDSHFAKSALPRDISRNVVVLADAAPNTCALYNPDASAIITKNCNDNLKKDIPVMQIFKTLQNMVRDENADIRKNNIKYYKSKITLVNHIQYGLNIPGVWRCLKNIGITKDYLAPYLQNLKTEVANVLSETEKGHTSQIFNPTDNIVFSTNEYNFNKDGVKYWNKPMSCYINVDDVRWAKNPEQLQMIGTSLLNESPNANYTNTNANGIVTTEIAGKNSEYLKDETSLYRLIEYLKYEKGFDIIFIRLIACRGEEHSTPAAKEFFKKILEIKGSNYESEYDDGDDDEDETFPVEFVDMQERHLENTTYDNSNIITAGGAGRRTRATTKRRTRRNVRKCRRSRRRH